MIKSVAERKLIMKKSKIFGSILALTLALVPTVGTVASNNSSCINSITASAATPGCYRVSVSSKLLTRAWEPYSKQYVIRTYYGAPTIPAGTYVSSNGVEYDGFIRITYAGQIGYYPKNYLTWYAN